VTPQNSTADALAIGQIPTLLRGEAQPIERWIGEWSGRRMCLYAAVIIAGTALFGGAIGSWRDPMQALFTAIKFPLIVLLTTLGNGLLNGVLAPLLGTNISFRQSLLVVMMSFTIAAAILGTFAPLMFFLVWNTPALSSPAETSAHAHSFMFVTLVAMMGFAGIAGNVRLLQLLRRLSGSEASARRTLWAWLAGNLLLGAQLAWILRPFVGSPSLPIEFLRQNALEGNFFEALFVHLKQLFS
jgi:hypothetical protein